MDQNNSENLEQHGAVTPPPYSPTNGVPPLKPNNWLWQAILVSLCCFPLFGIISVVNAIQVNSNYYAGNYAKAQRASRRARLWALVGLITGLIYFVVVMVMMTKGNFMDEISKTLSEGSYSIYNY